MNRRRIRRSGDAPSQKRDPGVNSSGTGPNESRLRETEIQYILESTGCVALNRILKLPDDRGDDERIERQSMVPEDVIHPR